MTERDPALDLYKAYKSGRPSFTFRKKQSSEDSSRSKNDPKLVGDLINELVTDRNWESGLSEGEIFVKWHEVVGDDVASHCQPIEIKDSKLIIQCQSTAWATQLNLVKSTVLTSVQKIAPAIRALEILGPNGPSWRKGLRTIQGAKGPRDTYG